MMARISAWSRGKFGADAEAVAAAITEGLHVAHGDALAAHAAGNLESADAYGTVLWLAAADKILERILEIDGATSVKPARARYTLGVVRDQVILSQRIGSDLRTPPTEARLHMSGVKSNLFRLGGQLLPADTTGSLYGEDWAPGPVMPNQPTDDSYEFDRHGLILAAYVSSPDGGLLAAWWGEAALEADGRLNWEHLEPLDLVRTGSPAIRPDLRLASDSPSPVRAFSDTPLEETFLELRVPLTDTYVETESTQEPRRPEVAAGGGDDA